MIDLPRSVGGPDLEWLLFTQSGILTYRQATQHLSPGTVRGLVRSGRWRRIVHGVLQADNGVPTRQQQLWTAVLVAGTSAVLAGPTAAIEAGVRGLRENAVHVLVPTGRHRPQRLRRLPPDLPGVAVRRTAILPPAHIQVGRPTRTSLPRAVVDASAWAASDDHARVIVASACQQRKVTAGELREVTRALPRLKRRALILETLTYVEGGAQALAEIDLVRLCRRAGLPVPDLQERRTDRAGRRRYLDAYWREWRLVVEVDGAHHMEVRQWEADLLRQNEIWLDGDRILRFSGYQVRWRPSEVVEQIRRALMAAGWRP